MTDQISEPTSDPEETLQERLDRQYEDTRRIYIATLAQMTRQNDLLERDIKERGFTTMSLFFSLPQEQQDFRLREEAMMIVARMEYTPLSSLNIFELADQIIDYIKNGRKV